MAPAITIKKDLYVLDDSGGGNPYAWDLDLCALTLANFNYRTMSLVRDYRELLDDGITSAVVRAALLARAAPASTGRDPATSRSRIATSSCRRTGRRSRRSARPDAARASSSRARPAPASRRPSRTSIADYVARGKRVLFVCQKRAAIDVVHARLRQRGLDELASLIHDSQADKKAFVMGLKGTYEAWLADGVVPVSAEARRQAVLDRLAAAVAEIEAYEAGLAEPAREGGPRLRDVIERLVDLRDAALGRRPADRTCAADRPVGGGVVARPDRSSDQLAAGADGRGRCRSAAGVEPVAVPGAERSSRRRPPRGRGRRGGAARWPRSSARSSATLDEASEPTAGCHGRPPAAGSSGCERGGGRASSGRSCSRSRAAAGRPSSSGHRRAAEELRGDVRAWQGPRIRPGQGPQGGGRLARAPRARRRPGGARDRDGQGAVVLQVPRRRLAAGQGGGRPPATRRGPRAVPVTGDRGARSLVAVHDAEAALDAAPGRGRGGMGLPRPRRPRRADRGASASPRTRPSRPGAIGWRTPTTTTSRRRSPTRGPTSRACAPTSRSSLEDVDDLPLGELAATLDALAEPRAGRGHPGRRPVARWPWPPTRRSPAPCAGCPAMPAEIEYAVCAATLEEAEATRPAVARFGGGPAGRAGRPAARHSCRRCTRPTRTSSSRDSGQRFLDDVGHAPAQRDGHDADRARAQEDLDDRPARARERVPQGHALPLDPRPRLGRDRRRRRRPPADLADEPDVGVRHAAARARPVRRRDLRRGEPDPGRGGRARDAPGRSGDRRRRPDAASADPLLHGHVGARTTTRTTRSRSASCSMATASSPSRPGGSRRRCSRGTTAAATSRSSTSATRRSTRAGSRRSPTAAPAAEALPEIRVDGSEVAALGEDAGGRPASTPCSADRSASIGWTARRTCSGRTRARRPTSPSSCGSSCGARPA